MAETAAHLVDYVLPSARCPEATDTCILHTNHTGILFSREAAQAVCRFLRTGRFGGCCG